MLLVLIRTCVSKFNSFGAKFQTTFFRRQMSSFVVCFDFLTNYQFIKIGSKFIWKAIRLNVKQRRSWWDGSLWVSSESAVCKSLFSSPVAVKQLMSTHNMFQWTKKKNLVTLGKIFSRQHIEIFPENRDFTFHANWQFVWNIKSCFLGKIRNRSICCLLKKPRK